MILLAHLTKVIICAIHIGMKVKQLKCPHCGSTRLRRRGFCWDRHGRHQRYDCKNCHKLDCNHIPLCNSPDCVPDEVFEWVDKHCKLKKWL